MTESQRKAMEHAIEALTKSVQFCNHMGIGDWQPTAMACHGGIAALRAALKEDNEVSFDKAEPAVEPAAEIYAPSYLPRAIDLRFTHYGTTLPAGTKLYAAPVRELAPEPVAEVVDYILQDDIHNRLTPRVVDIAYSAFMLGGFDWFNDAKPMVMNQIAKIKKDLAEEAAPVRGPAPPPPAEVPILTQDDIVQIILSSKHLPLGDAIRLTEKVVRQKAGLK